MKTELKKEVPLDHKKIHIKNLPPKWKKKDMVQFLDGTELGTIEEIQVSQAHVFFVGFKEEVKMEEVKKEFKCMGDDLIIRFNRL